MSPLWFGGERGRFTLDAEVWLPRPLAVVFPFFADPGNLNELTPPWLRFEIRTRLPVDMRRGTRIDYQLRVRGVRIRWQSEITAWEPPHRFVDEQRRGPYRAWTHEHTFASRGGGTLVRDHVEYAVPGGWVADRVFVRRDLGRIFAYRAGALGARFGTAE